MLPPSGTPLESQIVFSAVLAEIHLSFLRIPKNTQYMEDANQWGIQRFLSSERVTTMAVPDRNYELKELLIFSELCIFVLVN